jgi:hypothetical protein
MASLTSGKGVRPVTPSPIWAHYELNRHLELFGRVNNLFDTRFYTAAQLGVTGFTAEGDFLARPFAAVAGEFPLQHATFLAPAHQGQRGVGCG